MLNAFLGVGYLSYPLFYFNFCCLIQSKNKLFLGPLSRVFVVPKKGEEIYIFQKLEIQLLRQDGVPPNVFLGD